MVYPVISGNLSIKSRLTEGGGGFLEIAMKYNNSPLRNDLISDIDRMIAWIVINGVASILVTKVP
jgi:hypothetical protein